jgi:hypothetical protein
MTEQSNRKRLEGTPIYMEVMLTPVIFLVFIFAAGMFLSAVI